MGGIEAKLTADVLQNKRYSTTNKIIFVVLVCGFLLHLYWIPQHLGGHMEIRQADTAAIARNFAEDDPNILLPQIDWSGLRTGYVEADAQIYPFLVSLLYRVFGVHEWIGKTLSLLFSCLTAWYIFLFGLKIGDRRFALTATAVFFILPLEFFYGAAFMSEPLMLLCLIGALYHFVCWTENSRDGQYRLKDWLISLICLVIAASIKPQSLVIGLPLVVLSYQRFGWRFIFRKSILLYAFVALAIPAGYYHIAHQVFLTYGKTFWLHGYGIWLDPAQLTSGDFWFGMIAKVFSSRPLTYGGFALLIGGMFIGLKKFHIVLLFWIAGIAVSFFVIAKGNLLHDHYQMPLMIPATFFIARAIESAFYQQNQHLMAKIAVAGAIFLMVLQIGYKQLAFLEEARYASPRVELARQLDRILPGNTKLITLDDDSPLMLYYSHRTGWIEHPDNRELAEAKNQTETIFVAGEKRAVTSFLNSIPYQSELLAIPNTSWGIVAKVIL